VSAAQRAGELTVLRAEVDKLAASRATAEQAAVLRISSLHEEKAAQHTAMARVIDGLQRQLAASEQQMQVLRASEAPV
jgi:hypothetical protein